MKILLLLLLISSLAKAQTKVTIESEKKGITAQLKHIEDNKYVLVLKNASGEIRIITKEAIASTKEQRNKKNIVSSGSGESIFTYNKHHLNHIVLKKDEEYNALDIELNEGDIKTFSFGIVADLKGEYDTIKITCDFLHK